MSWSNKPSIYAGSYPTAAQLEAIIEQIDDLTGTGWTSYTPTWTANSSNPAIGNGTITARYRRVPDSDLVMYTGAITMGTTTTYGSGFWIVSFPVTATSAATATDVGSGYLLDAGTIARPVASRVFATTQLVFDSDGGSITATVPMTWAQNDELRWSLVYEAAV